MLFAFQSTLPSRGATAAVPAVPTQILFQSTLPSRGATRPESRSKGVDRYFNPRSPRGERRHRPETVVQPAQISIHAPLAGSDRIIRRCSKSALISIHAPLAGSDGGYGVPLHGQGRFQSTLPSRGATAIRMSVNLIAPNFNPRSPRGERLRAEREIIMTNFISIHAPLAGSD